MTQTIPLAEAFRYCPRCGAAGDGQGQNPFHCTACDFVFHFGPVSAVGAIIADAEGRVLLIRRAKPPGQDQYGLPGGFIDPQETAEAALRREVHEEVGLDLTGYEMLVTYPNTYDYRGVVLPVLDVFFVCTVDLRQPITAAAAEVTSWEWCECNENVLSQMAFESNRRALRTYLRTVGRCSS
ncbi:NUDIX hydrolase [Roseimaritima sediminicola]|uniref:NUDIX hydrolase n=1 Tax=Roseimaritima sediminicola TaxID=2662066 RepID=UPI0012985495|nr:NUDIX domain-containing protein [Roseimaritima sediminicola]